MVIILLCEICGDKILTSNDIWTIPGQGGSVIHTCGKCFTSAKRFFKALEVKEIEVIEE